MFTYDELKAFGRREFGTAYPWELNTEKAKGDELMLVAMWWSAMAKEVRNAPEMPARLRESIAGI